MSLFKRFRVLRILRKHAIPDHLWRTTTDRLVLLHYLTASEKARLRKLTTLFLHDKDIIGVQGIDVTDEVRVVIAAQACVEILYLGLDAFDGWVEVLVYPGAFRINRERVDEHGLVHQDNNVLSGEAWGQGPVILSWQDITRDSFTLSPGSNVIIHEFAHKLDMLNGRANGMPPLHPDMPIEQWTEALSRSYHHLLERLENDQQPRINPYAATDPAEFFAVICEYFFTAPRMLQRHEPEVYEQLKAYFRQDPAQRTAS